MAEALSPIPRQRLPMAARIQSPTTPFFLGSNDDKLERAQARAARAAAIRRNPIVSQPPPACDSTPCLDKDQILELFHNCIKLASENKINQKNTWELGLIDHLFEIVKVEAEDVETNFQKASCTLEAGIKIYSLRVDSVHSEAYKVLGGINRVGQESEPDNVEDSSPVMGKEKDCSKKDTDRKISPLSTLESSFDALNAKKFDAAFAVDPLYHQTSAQFDEGGAKGLLLNNLGVYDGCRVLFDSMELPGKCGSCTNQYDKSDIIDLAFAKEHIEQMVCGMQMKNAISPTLGYIVNQFDEDNCRPLDTFSSFQKSPEQAELSYNNEIEFDGDAYDNSESWNGNNDDQRSVADEEFNGAVPDFPSYEEESEPFSLQDPDLDDRFGKVDEYLISSLGFASKRNAWAGPDHWKYRRVKAPEDILASATENGSPITTKKPKSRKIAEIDIDFIEALDKEIPDIFALPKNPKSLLLPANRAPCNTTLPEDCHYQPENLVKLFLLPNIMCLGRKGRKSSGEFRRQADDCGSFPSWDDDGAFDGQFDDEDAHSDVEDSSTLVSQPRQVSKIEVQYDKTSKQVDVQALKETLWDHLQESPQKRLQEQEGTISFRNMLANFPSECRAAPIQDISPHLCFICLLHLANEHGLSIKDCDSLEDLSIRLPGK